MSKEIRVLSGFIEFNGERIAQVLPNAREWSFKDDLEALVYPGEVYDEDDIERSIMRGKAIGMEEASQGLEDVLDKLVSDGELSEANSDAILEKYDTWRKF